MGEFADHVRTEATKGDDQDRARTNTPPSTQLAMDGFTTQQMPMDQYVTPQTRPDAPKRAARWTPDAKDIRPDDPDWEVFGDKVVRIYANSLRPRGVDPIIWNSGGDAHKTRILAEVAAKERARKTA